MDRYSRQIAIEGIGKEGQDRIRKGSVMIIGCGALGSVVAMYLAAAGVGRLILADFDTVDLSNLQRQIFYAESETGEKKVLLLAKRIRALNPEVEVEVIQNLITLKNGAEYASHADFIIDATDNPSSKYMTDKLSESLGIPCCIGGVEALRGQLITIFPEDIRYRDLFADLPQDPGLTPCSIAGVLGPTAGVVASLQAAEALKFLSGHGKLNRNAILDLDLSNQRFTLLNL